MTHESFSGASEDRISQHEDALRAAGFDEEDIAAIRDFRENATDEDRRVFLETTIALRRDFHDSGIQGLMTLGKAVDGFLDGSDNRDSKPPLFFDGEYVDHGLSSEEWDGLDESTRRTLRDPEA